MVYKFSRVFRKDRSKTLLIIPISENILTFLRLYAIFTIGGSAMIERTNYLQKLIAWKDEQIIKVVTGIRRCGKSTLLDIYKGYLKENGIGDEQIISVNFEDLENEIL